MKSFIILFSLFLLLVYSLDNINDIHFHCRACGAIIANYSNITEKDAIDVDSISDLLHQKEGVQIQYDSFESSKVWKNKKLVYFSKVSEDVNIAPDKQVCPHFSGNYFSHITCAHCNNNIGFFVEELSEEEEEEDTPMEVSDYEEEDIMEMLNITDDGIEFQLKEFFLSNPDPTLTIGYWSYRYKHRHSIEQFHNKVKGNPSDVDLNWSLGTYDDHQSGTYGIDISTTIPTPYYQHVYINGQMCDEIKAPRQTEVRFEPCENTPKSSIRAVDEISICRYVIRICVPSLKKKNVNSRRKGFFALSMDDVIPDTDLQLLEVLEHDSFGPSINNYTCLNKHTLNVQLWNFENLKSSLNKIFSNTCNPMLRNDPIIVCLRN